MKLIKTNDMFGALVTIHMTQREYDEFMLLSGMCLGCLAGGWIDKGYRREVFEKLLEFVDELNLNDPDYVCYSEKFKRVREEHAK